MQYVLYNLQAIYKLHFPWPCMVIFTCSEMHLSVSFHYKVYAAASIMSFMLQDLATLCKRLNRTLMLGHSIPRLYSPSLTNCVCNCMFVRKGRAIPLVAVTGPERSTILWLTDFNTLRTGIFTCSLY
jgi:hypothetical protein